jgi:hypothetical protein
MKTNLPVTQTEVDFPKGRYIVSRTDLKGMITCSRSTRPSRRRAPARRAAASRWSPNAAHGGRVVSISRQIADGTREQTSAGDEIARQAEGIVDGIAQTGAAISPVTERAGRMKEGTAQLRQPIAYFRFLR